VLRHSQCRPGESQDDVWGDGVRNCINTVIASAAKQSRLPLRTTLDCFAALAMTECGRQHASLSCPGRAAAFLRCCAEPGPRRPRKPPTRGPRLCSAPSKRRCAASGARDRCSSIDIAVHPRGAFRPSFASPPHPQ